MTASELQEQMDGPRREAWLRYRQLLGQDGDVAELAEVLTELGLAADAVDTHRKAIAPRAEQTTRKERFAQQVEEFAQLAKRMKERSEELQEQTRAARLEIDDMAKQRISLGSASASLKQATDEVDAIETAFCCLFADEPADNPDPSTLFPEVRGILRNNGLLPPGPGKEGAAL